VGQLTKIFLLGLPGSGKTTLGKEVAALLKMSFVDLDGEIQASEGMTIREIFEKRTEDYFRMVESAQVKGWCFANYDFVMATGGGTPCFYDNMTAMNAAGTTVFLDVPPSEIADRMARAALSERPLLAKTEPGELKAQLTSMRLKRIPFYSQSQLVFSGESISATEIAEEIRKGSQW
jgi:shikimate kinase